MKIASVADVKARLSAYMRSIHNGPLVVTKHGKPKAVLISVEDEDELERLLLAYSLRFRAILETGRKQIRQGKGVEHAEFWKKASSGKP